MDQAESSRKELIISKEKWNNTLLSLRHLWREMSLLYSSGRSGKYEYLPKCAAACLIAGETLELYDGDANMLNVEWVTAIFKNLGIFTASKSEFSFCLSWESKVVENQHC